MLLFSESTQGYYDTNFAKYQLPNDVVEVSKEIYLTLKAATDRGEKVIKREGVFVFKQPEITHQGRALVENEWIKIELERAGFELDKVQDSDPKAVGSVSAWRSYRKSLRAWSDDINFPKIEYRPVSPDMVKE